MSYFGGKAILTRGKYEGILILTMRLGTLRNTPRIVFYLGLVGLLLLLLAISGKLNGPISNNKVADTQISPAQTQTLDESENEGSLDNEAQETSSTNSDISPNYSTSTKVHISVNSSSTNNEATGLFNLNINGNESDFSNVMDECLEKGEVEIDEDGSEIECELDEDGLKIEFDIDSNQNSTSKTEIETSVKTKSESD